MMPKFYPLFLLLLLQPGVMNAQMVKGKIYSSATDSVIAGATVRNIATGAATQSAKNGYYEIAADEGQQLIVTAIGYTPDTLLVEYHMTVSLFDITIDIESLSLKGVTVTSSYKADSLRRSNDYRYLTDKKNPGITGRNTPNGPGIVFSPISFFSKEAREKRKLKKRLLAYEEEDYVDRSFSKSMVKRLTRLSDDSVSLFMRRYRPSYAFCRATDELGMLVYVNDRLKEFRNPASTH